jgi:hypothetical protein
MACLAIAAYMLQDTCRAREHLGLALKIAQESGAVRPLLWALPAAGLLLAGAGETERAVELYALASRYPFVSKSCWFEDVVGREIFELAAALPPGVLSTIQERARAQDLEAAVADLLVELKAPRS